MSRAGIEQKRGVEVTEISKLHFFRPGSPTCCGVTVIAVTQCNRGLIKLSHPVSRYCT